MKKLALLVLANLYFVAMPAHARLDAPAFVVRPYLYSHIGDSICLSWSYQTAPTKVSAIFESALQSKNLELKRDGELFTAILPMPNCGFGEKNTYLVTGMSAPQEIEPINCPGELGQSTRFVFIADTQVDTHAGVLPLEYIVKQVEKNGGAAAIIVGGDLTQKGSQYNLWTEFFNAMGPLFAKTLLIPVMGNHEYHGNNQVPFWPHFFGVSAHNAVYTTMIGDAQIFVLNSNFTDDPALVEPEQEWLEKELASSVTLGQAKWRIVTFHHPPYSRGLMNNPLYPKHEYEIVQEHFVPLFEKYHVNLVLNGHVHLFERSQKNGIQYLIMGAAAGKIGPYGGINPYSLKSERIRTMATIDVSAERLHVTTTDLGGNVIDEISMMGYEDNDLPADTKQLTKNDRQLTPKQILKLINNDDEL